MNRPIKFRAWDGETMCYMPNTFVGVGQVGFSDEHYVDLGLHDNETVELMQYTGLKDVNGVEIYEGDILLDGWDKSRQRIGRVSFDLGSFSTDFCDSDHRYSRMTDSEVIGNIHEHPELLKGGAA